MATCRICGIKLILVEVHSAFKTFKIGKFCKKCKRFIPGNGINVDRKDDTE